MTFFKRTTLIALIASGRQLTKTNTFFDFYVSTTFENKGIIGFVSERLKKKIADVQFLTLLIENRTMF
jgi:hypothetical protein